MPGFCENKANSAAGGLGIADFGLRIEEREGKPTKQSQLQARPETPYGVTTNGIDPAKQSQFPRDGQPTAGGWRIVQTQPIWSIVSREVAIKVCNQVSYFCPSALP